MKYTTLQDSFFYYYWQNVSEHFADFQGKASREEYWMFTLWSAIVTTILSLISFGVLGGIYSILIIIPQSAINVRRYHDIDKPGWIFFAFMILFFIPFVNIIVLLIHIFFMVQPSKDSLIKSNNIPKVEKDTNSEESRDIPIDKNKHPNAKRHRRNY
jgi:uncharacterized membrane protein YhaH (DUF805 family)